MGQGTTSTHLTEAELWGLTFKRLVLWTVRKHRVNVSDAEEIVQDAIRLFLRAGGVVDTANPRALFLAIGSGVNGIAVNMRRKKSSRMVALTDDGFLSDLDQVPAAADGPEQRMIEDQLARRRTAAMLKRVQGDELALGILTLMAEGVSEPAEQAKALGHPVAEVYNARRRLKSHADTVAKLMESW
jgi:DNA-directed RNA polymerase specialized sigma24 family protein